ncbi:MAG: amylo-alpha-1,6-glucosidase [Nitrospirae bacterium]|nr:amylo-alpha-1,6-glucosidase [Nitrospirota bacterium]
MLDIKTFGLKDGDLFVILNALGDITPSSLSPHEGLYRDDTRFLSKLELKINSEIPRILSSTVKSNNLLFTADLSNPVIDGEKRRLRKDKVHIFRSFFLYHNTLYGKIRLINYDKCAAEFSIQIEFDADFYDIFELRGAKRRQRGEILLPEVNEESVIYSYRGRDNITRYTKIRFLTRPDHIDEHTVRYNIKLKPKQQLELLFTVTADYKKDGPVLVIDKAYTQALKGIEEIEAETVRLHTSNEHFNELLHRSRADICTMLTDTPYGKYYYAGIPWYCTAFGRDGIITALQCMWIAPTNAKGVLNFLAAHQAKEVDPRNDAEPGKIPHEMRSGEMARTEEVPFRRYYGTVDATPLYIVLAGEYLKRTGDLETIESLWPNIKAAMQWMINYGDIDGDGFIEYHRHRPDGLINQGWKDSFDSVFHADGTLATGPIALVEVQGYAYLAYNHIVHIAKSLGDKEVMIQAQQRAKLLRKRFHRAFWSKKIGMYGIALDGQKRLCEVKTSNAGQVLLSGIVSNRYAKAIARKLMDRTFFSGWGIRTVAKDEILYNPMSYHNGSVWPHDNSLIGWGLQRYNLKDEILNILTGLFDASLFIDLRRLPELFCGFDRRPEEGPTLYPVACQPQAWASGAVFLLLQAAIGIEFECHSRSIIFKSPRLPEYIEWLEIDNLGFEDARVKLSLERYKDDVVVKVVEKEGDINVVIYK